MHRLAFFDPLTELPNRARLLDTLHHALLGSARSNKIGALMFCDLDNFKTLNDTRGHAAGDNLLQAVARRLDVRTLRLDTRHDLVEARSLYVALGYLEVPAFNAGPYAEHWFAKPLT